MPSASPAEVEATGSEDGQAGMAGEEGQKSLVPELGWRSIKHRMQCELMARRDIFFELFSRKHIAATELSGLFRI